MYKVLQLVPRNHGVRPSLALALRHAFFTVDPITRKEVEAKLPEIFPEYTSHVKEGVTLFDIVYTLKSKFILSRVKRFVPSSKLLVHRLTVVKEKFENLKDVKTGVPLMSTAAKNEMTNAINLAKHGHFSDPPDLVLYHRTGTDRWGLSLFRCDRGSNRVESMHQKMIALWPRWMHGPELSIHHIRRFTHSFNCNALVRLGYGLYYILLLRVPSSYVV
jgi:hypothetical protein